MIQSKPEKSRGSFLWEGAGGDFFFKRNLLPPYLFLVPLKNKCACNIFEDEQTHCIRGTTSIGAYAPTSIPDNGRNPKGHNGEKIHVPALARQRPSPIHRAELSPSSARFSADFAGIKLPHSLICNSKQVYREGGKMSIF